MCISYRFLDGNDSLSHCPHGTVGGTFIITGIVIILHYFVIGGHSVGKSVKTIALLHLLTKRSCRSQGTPAHRGVSRRVPHLPQQRGRGDELQPQSGFIGAVSPPYHVGRRLVVFGVFIKSLFGRLGQRRHNLLFVLPHFMNDNAAVVPTVRRRPFSSEFIHRRLHPLRALRLGDGMTMPAMGRDAVHSPIVASHGLFVAGNWAVMK